MPGWLCNCRIRLLTTSGGIATNVSLYKLPYDPRKDLAPVALLAQMPYLIAAHPSVSARSAQDLINLAKAQPGKIAFSSSGAGTSSHLAGEMFKTMTKTNLLMVPYKGAGPALTDLMGGHVQMLFALPVSVIQHVQRGAVRGIAISGLTRLPVLAQIPTFTEAGLPGFSVNSWQGVLAPARTPRAIIDKLSAEYARILRTPDVRDTLQKMGADTMIGSPEQFAAYIKSEIVKWAKIVRDSNIAAQ